MELQEKEMLKKRERQRQKEREAARAIRIRKNKLTAIGVMCCIVLTGLMGRVFYIKSVYGDVYERRAAEQEFNRKNIELTIAANRGNISDRNMQSLAISYSVDKIIMDIRNLVELDKEIQNKTMENLNKYLDIPMETLAEYLKVDETGKPIIDKSYYVIKKQVPRETTVELLASEVRCIYSEEDSMRSYVHKDLASQVIGFVWGDTSWGIERKYDEQLVGTSGRLFKYRDSEKNTVSERRVDAVNGYSLVTTLDMTIQQFAENAVLKAAEEYEPENASVIVMNPQTGEILAMAQYPSFNLNDPMNIEDVNSQKFRSELEALSEAERLDKYYTMWGNFNVSRTFEPGSIFKPMVVAAALEENVISTSSGFNCDGHKWVLDRDIGCWIRSTKGSHGSQTLTEVLANSCNVGLMDIAEKMGRDIFFKYQHDFGYGEKTGIDLPGEISAAALLHKLSGLNPVELATSSIGQSFNNTPIQAINAFSAVINGGNLMKPYVVSQVLDENGNVIMENTPSVQRKVISHETSDWMRIALQSVVTPEGTGKKAVIKATP